MLDGIQGYLAFCDQDDVWHPDKLSLALQSLGPGSDAALYCARSTVCDQALRPLTVTRDFRRPFTFRNALVQTVSQGNTCVLTPAATELLRRSAPPAIAQRVEAHDWWLYLILTGAGARIIRDNRQVLMYRQHGRNVSGRNDTLNGMLYRFRQLHGGDYADWLRRNVDALQQVSNLLTPENRVVLQRFDAALRLPGPMAARALARLGIYRQTPTGTATLMAMAAAGRLG